ncbi:MAG: hypothetical protein GEV08_01410 [Acidimicrobiia bacterium]|nr:hypothetical protein [Acidimicrobiia bacterium]
MTVRFLDPRADPGAPVEPYLLGIDVTAGPIDIGMLANGFPDSVAFLDQLAASLAEVLPEARFRHYDKGDASIVVPDELLAEVTGACQAVVAAYGH